MDLSFLQKCPVRKGIEKWREFSCGAAIGFCNVIPLEGVPTSVCFLWAVSVAGQIQTGTDLYSFREFCFDLSEAAGYDCTMMVYNTTEFFQFVRRYFDAPEVFADKEREPLDALILPGLHLRSGKMLSGMSLSEIGKTYGCTVRRPSYEYPALAPGSDMPLDVLSMVQEEARAMELLMADHIQRAGSIAKVPLTKTGYVRRYLRDLLLWGRGEGATKRDYFAGIEYRKIMNMTPLSEIEYTFLDGVSCGSICGFRPDRRGKIEKHVLYFDRKSAYPAHILYDYVPNGIAQYFDHPDMERVKKAMKTRCVAGLFRFSGIKARQKNRPVYLRESMVETVENAEIKYCFVTKAAELTIYLTELDFESIHECYTFDTVECIGCIIYNRGVMPYKIKKYTLARFAEKERAKEPAERRVKKEMLNAIYGIFVTNPVREQYVYDPEAEKWEESTPDIADAIANYNSNPSRFYRFCWGVWIAAHCRRAEWRAWMACGEFFVYGDTDSALCRYRRIAYYRDFFEQENARIRARAQEEAQRLRVPLEMFEPEGELLGSWSLSDGTARMCINGIKNYIMESADGKIKIVMAGIDPDLSGEYVRKRYGKSAVDEFSTITYYPSRYKDPVSGEILSATGRKMRFHQDFTTSGEFYDVNGDLQTFETLSGIVQMFAPVTRKELSAYNEEKRREYGEPAVP